MSNFTNVSTVNVCHCTISSSDGLCFIVCSCDVFVFIVFILCILVICVYCFSYDVLCLLCLLFTYDVYVFIV